MTEKELTGYPSIDKPWLKYYSKGAEEKARHIPENVTIWDFIEERLKQQGDSIPALEYFGKKVTRTQFISSVYTWASVFKSIGVSEDEVVCIYSPWFPEIAYMLFALNAIGAASYCLKLAITNSALEEETSKSKIAVVFDGMWENVKAVFEQERFETIIIVSAHSSMSFPKKQVVSILNYKNNAQFPKENKYLTADRAIKQYANYHGTLKAAFKKNRTAFITSSSGTSINGIVKGISSTNEAAISQCIQAESASVNYIPSKRVLTNFPPTASTALNCLFLYPLYFNMTLIIEPRMSEEGFYNQIKKYRPNVVIITGSLWKRFFRDIEKETGNTLNLDFFDMPILGGEGVDPEDLKLMNGSLKAHNSNVPMFSGYGLSEALSVISVDKLGTFQYADMGKAVIDVGIPYPAITVGVFDNDGKELTYGQRGELWIQSDTVMKEYYDKTELTAQTVVDGWLHTGDLFEIDKNGFLYCYGRLTDKILLSDGTPLYLFDIANELRKDQAVKYTMVNALTDNGTVVLVAHLVLHDDKAGEQENLLRRLDARMKQYLPDGLSISGYKIHPTSFRSSPTTAKIDRNYYMQDTKGYIKPTESGLIEIDFTG